MANAQKKLLRSTIEQHQQRLEKVRSMTGSYDRASKIDAALRQLQKFIWDLDADKSQRSWEKVLEDAQEVLEEAEKVENDTYRWHSKVGWIWFGVFALILLIPAGLYAYFHYDFLDTVGMGTDEGGNKVFFWHGDYQKFGEIAFWTLFGLLTFILYNLQHWVRQKSDWGLWGLWYLSKLLQGVFIAFVIVLVFVQLEITIADTDVDFSTANMPIFIILAFILGYYSDRARDYLDVVRDRFLSGTNILEVEIESPKDDLTISTTTVVVRGKATGSAGLTGTLIVGTKEPVTNTRYRWQILTPS